MAKFGSPRKQKRVPAARQAARAICQHVYARRRQSLAQYPVFHYRALVVACHVVHRRNFRRALGKVQRLVYVRSVRVDEVAGYHDDIRLAFGEQGEKLFIILAEFGVMQV